MTEIRESRKILAVLSKGNGPWVPVRRLRRIEVQGGSKEDVVRIHFGDHDLMTSPEPVFIRGSHYVLMDFPRGSVRVERVAGRKPLTIMAVCERSHNVTKAFGKRSVHRDNRV